MKQSILNTIKRMIGPSQFYNEFDTDLIIHINTALMILAQLGVIKDGTRISDETTTWDEIVDGRQDLEGIKDYVYIKVKLLFDTPASSIIQSALEKNLAEIEWRLHVFSDNSEPKNN